MREWLRDRSQNSYASRDFPASPVIVNPQRRPWHDDFTTHSIGSGRQGDAYVFDLAVSEVEQQIVDDSDELPARIDDIAILDSVQGLEVCHGETIDPAV